MQFNPQKTFFSSDLHQGHRNIIRYSNRPFSSLDEMHEKMVMLHNQTVSKDSTWWHLGDLSFAKNIDEIIEYLKLLNGKKHLILGNHDQIILKNRDRLIGEGIVEEIVPYKEIYCGNQFIVLFHYGCRVWNKSHRNAWLLYGHSHNSLAPLGKSVDVGYDADWVLGHKPYRPLSFYEIKDFMDQQVPQDADHHK